MRRQQLGRHRRKRVRRRLGERGRGKLPRLVIRTPDVPLQLDDLVGRRAPDRLLKVPDAQRMSAEPRVDRVDVQAPHPPRGKDQEGGERDTGQGERFDIRDYGGLQQQQAGAAHGRGPRQDRVVEQELQPRHDLRG